jgi:hypothetical protein
MSKQKLIVPIAAFSAALALSVTVLAAGGRTTKDGIFTAEQAERGKIVYEKSCKNCHQAEFYTEKLSRYADQPVTAFYEVVSGTMPADNVGSLLTKEYIDVLAYVFSITGSTPGKTELTTESMDEIKIAKPE